jgi:hypothetical protein
MQAKLMQSHIVHTISVNAKPNEKEIGTLARVKLIVEKEYKQLDSSELTRQQHSEKYDYLN